MRAADFFTTEVWTVRGLVTYYTLFVIELESRRVCRFSKPRDPFLRTFSKPFPPLE